MPRIASTQRVVLGLLADGVPRGVHVIHLETGLAKRAVEGACYRAWKGGKLLRSKEALFGRLIQRRGRAGTVSNFRSYYMYTLRPEGEDSLVIDGVAYVLYADEYLSSKVPKGKSKSQKIIDYIKENRERAFYSNDIFVALKGEGINKSDIMSTVRRYEKKGQVFVRGYRTEKGQTPFSKGFLMTGLDENLPRKQAIEEAFQRTEKILFEDPGSNVTGQRVRAIRDQVIAATQMGEIVGMDFIQNHLKCTKGQAKYAVDRTLRLYRDVKSISIFNYRYLYHESLSDEELRAAVIMKENYIRKVKGRDNRIGHNWESAVEWFVDTFTRGADFLTQQHRDKTIDSRRIILHLIKSVGGRRYNAEVDRVWSITPGPFSQEITYVLQSKWGLIRKRDLDDHLEVLRWSNEFGVDTPEGREIKQGVMGVFAGSAFNPNDKVRIGQEKITLAQYAARKNLDLIKASDLNQRLRNRNVDQFVTVQKICRFVQDEDEVRDTLKKIWNQPEKARDFLTELAEKNKELYEFEKMLEETRGSDEPVTKIPS